LALVAIQTRQGDVGSAKLLKLPFAENQGAADVQGMVRRRWRKLGALLWPPHKLLVPFSDAVCILGPGLAPVDLKQSVDGVVGHVKGVVQQVGDQTLVLSDVFTFKASCRLVAALGVERLAVIG
jgi:hypothetical protein